MPRIQGIYAHARRRAHYLRLMRSRRGRPGYRGQTFYKRQWPHVYRGMLKSRGLRRRYRYGPKQVMARRKRLYPRYY